jgi:hypothetical protein
MSIKKTKMSFQISTMTNQMCTNLDSCRIKEPFIYLFTEQKKKKKI